MCQSVSCFTVGQEYTLSFLATRRDNCSGSPQDAPDPMEIFLSIDGGVLNNYSIIRTGAYNLNQVVSITFIATQPSHLITLHANQVQACGMVVDDFLITSSFTGFINGNLDLGNVNWNDGGCQAEINIEELYDDLSISNTNMVAEIDSYNGLCQSVNNFVPGQNYTISFLATRRNNCVGSPQNAPDPMISNLTVDGGALVTQIVRTGAYNLNQPYTVSFTATQPTHLISINANQTQSCGMIIDSLVLDKEHEDCSIFRNDTIILCKNDTLLLDASQPNSSYLWQDGSNNSNYTVTQQGIYYVEVTSEGGCVCTDTVVVNLDSTCFSNVNTLAFGSSELVIYPNPASNQLNVKLKELSDDNLIIQIYDLSGKKITNFNVNTNSNITTIDIKDIESGIYFISLINQKTKIIKQTKFIKL